MRILKQYTTDSSIYDITSVFLVRDNFQTKDYLKSEENLGFSSDFINIFIIYRSKLPRVNMIPYLNFFGLNPHYLPRQPFIISGALTSNNVLVNGKHPILPFPYTEISHLDNELYFICNMENKIYTDCVIPVIRYQTIDNKTVYYQNKDPGVNFCGSARSYSARYILLF